MIQNSQKFYQFDFTVHVQELGTEKSLKSAEVVIQLDGQLPNQVLTDDRGTARFLIDSTLAGKSGRIIVEKKNFKQFRGEISIKEKSPALIVQLEPAP